MSDSPFCLRDFGRWAGAPSDADLRSTSDGATNPAAKRPRQKNGRSEERPSSGRKRPGRASGTVIREHDAALQQYDGIPVLVQGTKKRYFRQNAAETLEKNFTIAAILALLLVPSA
jgi:hypothetical protein